MLDIIAGELPCYVHRLSPEFAELLFVPTSDVHYGNRMFSHKAFDVHRKAILETPNMFTFLNGDQCESTIKSSKGEIFSQVGTPQDQRDWTIERWYPVRHKILGVSAGNHEMRIYNETGIDISKDIADALGVPYRAEGLLVRIHFGAGNDGHKDKQYVYHGYFTHGYGGARTNAAKAIKVERSSTYVHSDFYVMSHDHVVNAASVVYLIPDTRSSMRGGFEVARMRAYLKKLVKSNAFLKWGGYAEMGGFPPVDMETPIVKLAGSGKRRVRVET